jgi:hypothetical protein
MNNRDKSLKIVLQVLGWWTLVALGAVVMPRSWMAATHEWLGLGEFPTAPIVESLARSLSAFYAMFGAFCLMLAWDIERYRPLIKLLGAIMVLFGVSLFGIDSSAGMPPWWTVSEGLATLVFGVLVLGLSRAEQ